MTTANSLLEPAVLERIKGLSLVARRVVEGALHGMHRSSMRGLSIEFAQHRPYTFGDELKHLDWQVLARTDRYVVRQYEQETNLRAMVFVDCSGSMAYDGRAHTPDEDQSTADHHHSEIRTKFQYAQVLAASLSYLMLHQGDSVGTVMVRQGLDDQVAPRAAPGHVASICRALAEARPRGRTDIAGALTQLAARLKRRSLIILVSDLLDDPRKVLDALGRVHHRGHEVVIFQVLDPHEITFDLGPASSGVTVLRDMETGEDFEAEPALIRDMVEAEVRQFLDTIDAGCRAHGLHLVRCRTDEPVEQTLSGYLHYRHRSRKGGAR